ncbi:MAG: hypothetical protein HC838_12445 [Spirulinaceae cyanobacterium RM2_2_10]|nr:hypothetical protein [Spirulinaceae cyanobacterium SM2_1_0]NJO20678.1 hypothetical protein [Spirulinaceae cyanobacterium RM2_2_10]
MEVIQGENYQASYDAENATVRLTGSLRLSSPTEYQPIVDLLNAVAAAEPPTIVLDLRQLEFLNSSGISMLSKFAIAMRKRETSNIVVRGSSSIPWQGKSLKNLQRLMPNLTLELN